MKKISELTLENAALMTGLAQVSEEAKKLEARLVLAEARHLKDERILKEALIKAAADFEKKLNSEDFESERANLLAKIFLEYPEVGRKYGPRIP